MAFSKRDSNPVQTLVTTERKADKDTLAALKNTRGVKTTLQPDLQSNGQGRHHNGFYN